MAQDQQYDEVIETSGVKIPFIARIITPKIERPMRNNRYESGECKTLRALLRPGDRVLELGAGIGLISSVAAKIEGVESVTAIEANPELIPMIEETYRLNGITGVDLRNGVVVASNRKRAPFYLRADFRASSMEPDSRAFVKKKHLPCYNIRNLIEEKNPTVIVCDIEGGELGLFDGADLSGVRAMVLEFHPKVYGAETVEDITRAIQASGLILQQSDKPSSVRCFMREADAPVPVSALVPAVQDVKIRAVKPDLTGLGNKRWKTRSARFLITTCMKDEGPFIIDWLAWHKSIGIQDFVIFTNDCTDGTDILLDQLEDPGLCGPQAMDS